MLYSRLCSRVKITKIIVYTLLVMLDFRGTFEVFLGPKTARFGRFLLSNGLRRATRYTVHKLEFYSNMICLIRATMSARYAAKLWICHKELQAYGWENTTSNWFAICHIKN